MHIVTIVMQIVIHLFNWNIFLGHSLNEWYNWYNSGPSLGPHGMPGWYQDFWVPGVFWPWLWAEGALTRDEEKHRVAIMGILYIFGGNMWDYIIYEFLWHHQYIYIYYIHIPTEDSFHQYQIFPRYSQWYSHSLLNPRGELFPVLTLWSWESPSLEVRPTGSL